MSSTVVAKNLQVGADGTASNNFTIYQPASPDGTLRIGNGNTGTTSAQVVLTSAGNVGIGTSSPLGGLDVLGRFFVQSNDGVADVFVNGTTNRDALVRFREATTQRAYIQSTAGTSNLIFGINTTERMRIDSAGKLLSPNGAAFVGTVSNSGNGAIIERGSNANGEYVRYADGTQIATKRVDFSGITLNPANGSGNSALIANLDMAASFVSARYTFGQIRLRDSGGNDVYGGEYVSDGSLLIFHSGLRPINVWPSWGGTGSTVVTNGYYDIIAIGRWF